MSDENNSEVKNITELNFGISKAEQAITTINSLLEKSASLGQNYAKKVTDEINKIDTSKFEKLNLGNSVVGKNDIEKILGINAEKFKKDFDDLQSIGKTGAKKIATTIMNESIKTTETHKRNLDKINEAEKQTNLKILESEAKKADKLEIINAELEASKEKAAYKSELRQEEYNNKIANSTETMYSKIASYAKTYLIYQGFNELKQLSSELVTEMVDVEYQMVEIDRVLNDSSLDINKYRDELIQLAYDYGNSFNNVADVTLRLAQAGFDAQQSLALTEKTLLALNTAELDATEATSDMVAVMSQWNLMTGTASEVSENYGAIIDKINKVADNFPTTSEDILNALKKTSSAFNLAGASIDETIALITTAEIASQRGGKAIGTAMNNIIQQLKDDGRLATMESLGLDIYTDETKAEFKSVIDIITQLSEKMQELQASGKQNSVEMQELLSVFTLFRRNVGAGLLSGVAGEDSTYQQVLETSMDSLGYSLEENEKHLKTAKAAQEQFNATLLKLKTEVWDNGGEDVFRSLLLLGNDITKVFSGLIDTFGTLPTTMGIVTLAFSAFNKQLQVARINQEGTAIEANGFFAILKGGEAKIKSVTTGLETEATATNVAKEATLGLRLATVALNAAWSLGLSLAITTVISMFDKFIHASENFRKEQEEIISNSNEVISKNKQEAETIEDLIKDYEQYANKKGTLSEEDTKGLENSQKAISEYLIQNNKFTKEMVGNYELQLKTLKEITEEKRKQNIEEAKTALIAARNKEQGIYNGIFTDYWGNEAKALKKAGIEDLQGTYSLAGISKLDLETQLSYFEKWNDELEQTGQRGTKAYKIVQKYLTELREQTTDTEEALKKLNNEIVTQKFDDFLDEHDIQTVEDYNKALQDISNLKLPEDFEGSLEDFQAIMEQTLENTFPNFSGKLQEVNEGLEENYDTIESNLEKLSALQTQYTSLTTAANEYNETGSLTVGTLKSLVDNDLLQYLDLVNGKLQFNEEAFLASANEAKTKAVADLQAKAAAEIAAIAQADYNKTLTESTGPTNTLKKNTQEAGNAALECAKKAIVGATSWDTFYSSMKGADKLYYSGISKDAQKQIDNVLSRLNKEIATINSVSLTAAKSSASGSKSATKTFEEQSEERVNIFKKEIDDLESLEQSWVNKYKKLELFSTSDLKFITHQRINRYNEYLNQINQLTGISEEDRTALIREYSSKRQEAELEYFDLLKQQLDDQIKAFQEANQKRIDQIKEEADAQIEALKKVEDENDRIREKEEYEAKRRELIYGNEGIEYWKQRTGREAQLALQEAQKELEELDKDWAEKKEEWTLEEQIEEIEKARDAQIEAIEEAQETQIEAWRAAYQAQVDLYAQTGQIIYDDSVINAGYLYNAYMDNFVTPLNIRLREIMASIEASNIAASQAAARATQAAQAAQAANQVVKQWQGPVQGADLTPQQKDLLNRTTKAGGGGGGGRFHNGGEVGSPREAFALVKPHEVILKPEWASGLNKLITQINRGDNIVNNNASTKIDVEGNLVNLDAKINNKQDADYLTKQIEKVLLDKFNIKK